MSRHFFFILLMAVNSVAMAHPVSHTDAWVTVSDAVEVRLNVFLDDVVRHQLSDQIPESSVSADDLKAAIQRHETTLLRQLRFFQHGVPLVGDVVAAPKWQPRQSQVDLKADASLKLTWNLRFELANSHLRTLCILHRFTDDRLTKPGELRLNLRRKGSSRRISATIPPFRPYTVVIPGDADVSAAAGNRAVSRLIVGPSAVVHEFTAPLLLLDTAWPEVVRIRESALHGELSSVSFPDNSSEIETARDELSRWFLANVKLQNDETDLEPVRLQVEFLSDRREGNGSDFDAFSEESDVAFFGTTVGVRASYPPQAGRKALRVVFAARPGPFDQLTVESVGAAGQASELVDFRDSASVQRGDAVLEYQWMPPAPLAFGAATALAEPDANVLTTDLVTIREMRPGRVGTAFGIAFFFTCFVVIIRKSGLKRRWMRACLLNLALAVAIGVSYLMPDLRMSAAPEPATSVVRGLLCGVYSASLQLNQDDALSQLGRYLEEDLVESVWLSMVGAMMSAETGEMFIDLESVSVDSLACDLPVHKDRLTTRCTWRVRGTVHHWGHAHVRELVSTGQIRLVRDGDQWRIQKISLSEPGRISRPEPNGENS